MLKIDGAQGEGGGQILRTALALSVYLGLPVEIKNIRAGRKKPGLMRQHLACVRAAQQISDATVSGDAIGSQALVFKPEKVRGGHYAFSVGSAGSTSLIFQTIFLPLALSDAPAHVTFSGGTHNDLAPSYDFLARCFLPVVSGLGYRVTTALSDYGFQPVGQGAWRADILPVEGLVPYTCLTRGALKASGCVAISAQIPEHVNARELAHLQQRLAWDGCTYEGKVVNSAGPGNVVFAYQQYENITVLCDAVGAFGVSAERVAGRVVKAMRSYLETTAPVEAHLADQLLLPLLLGRGGEFVTGVPSQHLETNIAVIRQMCGADIGLVSEKGESGSAGLWRVTVPPLASVR